MQIQVLQIPPQAQTADNQQIPDWVKNNAKSWAIGNATRDEFVKSIQYLMQNGIVSSQPKSINHIMNVKSNATVNKVTGTSQIVLSDNDLLAMANNKYSDGNVPLGDGKYVTTEPKKGFVYLCHVPPNGSGAQENGPWIHGNAWNFLEKLSVSGSVSWPSAFFSNVISDNTRTLSGNDLPVGNSTGLFPISSSDPISKYDRNPNSISQQSYNDKLPANPMYSDTPYCMGGEVGIMLTGVPLFDAFDAELRDAPAHEAQDSCNGHPQVSGEYHYHGLSSCLKNIDETTVLGYALDGFPITGPKVANDKFLTTDDLDECHGITSAIMEDGKITTTYHYVMTYDFPYSVSCFRGKPAEYMVINNQQSVSNQNGPNQNISPQNGFNQNGPTQGGSPPQEAINACNGKSQGNSCSFISPRGDVISGTCKMSPSYPLACVPS